jgi:hypothetical protein
MFLDGPTLCDRLESDPVTAQAIDGMRRILEDGWFFVVLSGPQAEGNREKDQRLLRSFRSRDPERRAEAVLKFVYNIRCNTFHGSKNFDRVQIPVLEPCITVLSRLNRLLFDKLKGRQGQRRQ